MIRWKQFLIPVKAYNANQAKKFIEESDEDQFTILDVRQPSEYERGHIPGAKLIPIPDLSDRLSELDKSRTHLVYCAIGGRSRMAAQMLAGRGFDKVINLTGGFKEWSGHAATGGETLGIAFFTGRESPVDTLIVAYSLEEGLKEFYLSMADKVKNEKVRKIFLMLAQIEVKHQETIFNHFLELSDGKSSREEFEKNIIPRAVEGGLTTEEYAQMFNPDWESPEDIVSLAMSIEAQALDMYSRAGQATGNEKSRTILMQIAGEERTHLVKLGALMDGII